MKLKFGNIQLCEWQSYGSIKKPEDIYWARDFYPSDTYRDLAISIRKYFTLNRRHVIFYGSIGFLNDHFSQCIKGDSDLELAKEQVDKFLIRMNKLMVFL